MKYAIVSISGKQVLAEEGKTLTVDRMDIKEGESHTTDQIFLAVNDDDVIVGTPTVNGATVELKVLKHYQGRKTDIFKYKAKSRYRRSYGFRPQLTDIEILKIAFSGSSQKQNTETKRKVKKTAAKSQI